MFPIADGLSYSLPLMLILLSHELGHFIVARACTAWTPRSLTSSRCRPRFGLGTMGAVIGMRNVTSDRRKLIDIGAAGPLAGLLVAVPVHPVRPRTIRRSRRWSAGGMQEGNSLLYALLKHAATGAWLPDGQRDVFLNPTAWAAGSVCWSR